MAYLNRKNTQLFPTVSLTEATTVTSTESGKTFFLNLAGGFTVTLPNPTTASGMKFTFIVGTAPTTAYILDPAGDDNIVGFVNESTGGDGDYDAAADTMSFVANTALPGDTIELFSDGTVYYAKAFVNAAGAVTLDG
jgi:hypothetical protein